MPRKKKLLTLREALETIKTTKLLFYNLRRYKIKGYPASACDCPIANYLKVRTGHEIGIGGLVYGISDKETKEDISRKDYMSVDKFITDFDSGRLQEFMFK